MRTYLCQNCHHYHLTSDASGRRFNYNKFKKVVKGKENRWDY